MKVIAAPRRRGGAGAALRTLLAAATGLVLLSAGLAAGYLLLSTSFVGEMSRLGQGRVAGPVVGALVWGLAFLVPGLLLVAGVARLATALDHALGGRGPRRPVAAMARQLPDDLAVAESVRLPDGRVVPEVVVGPMGVLVVEALPPLRAVRVRGRSWEVRLKGGRWLPIENPLDRAARDADRLRSWLSSEVETFSSRVQAAVLADGHDLARTPEVAVITREQLAGFLAGLAPSRQMTPEQQARVIELLRGAL
ncbi:MAG TPA: hypothetical protein VFK38_07755 [Candidatus Limnocylindrales bacterium]|nr:hypothetical protein [Candidatus Limnocylindrales bacterium]